MQPDRSRGECDERYSRPLEGAEDIVVHWSRPRLLQVCLNYVDQLLGAAGSGAAFTVWIHDVDADVILDNLRHQAVHRATRGDDEMKNLAASFFLVDRAFERFDLAAHAPDPVQELGFFFDGVRHSES